MLHKQECTLITLRNKTPILTAYTKMQLILTALPYPNICRGKSFALSFTPFLLEKSIKLMQATTTKNWRVDVDIF